MNNWLTLRMLVLWLGLTCAAGTTMAQSPDRVADQESLQRNETAALRLVEEHLPQLSKVLEMLRKESPEQYARAVSDLSRQARRLDAAQRRSTRLFELELEVLKRQTRVDLQVAKLQLRDTPEMRDQLRRTLDALQQARRARLLYEREQLQQRLARTQQQLESVEQRLQSPASSSPEWIEKTHRNLLRKVGRAPAADSAKDADEQPGKSSR